MQGYIQISSFDLREDNSAAQDHSVGPMDYIIFSRRSRDRAGLRYQRRGVDDEAHVANFVETEVITRIEVSESVRIKSRSPNLSQRDGISNVFSYVQIRGSSEHHSDCQNALHDSIHVQFRCFGHSQVIA